MDRASLLLSVSMHAANHHQVKLVQSSFDFYMIGAMPEVLIGGRAYDSDDLDDEMGVKGVKIVRRIGRAVRSRIVEDYTARRWIVEPSFAWIKHRRRLSNRWGRAVSAELPRVRADFAEMLLLNGF